VGVARVVGKGVLTVAPLPLLLLPLLPLLLLALLPLLLLALLILPLLLALLPLLLLLPLWPLLLLPLLPLLLLPLAVRQVDLHVASAVAAAAPLLIALGLLTPAPLPRPLLTGFRRRMRRAPRRPLRMRLRAAAGPDGGRLSPRRSRAAAAAAACAPRSVLGRLDVAQKDRLGGGVVGVQAGGVSKGCQKPPKAWGYVNLTQFPGCWEASCSVRWSRVAAS
jgi:hypothetical protein